MFYGRFDTFIEYKLQLSWSWDKIFFSWGMWLGNSASPYTKYFGNVDVCTGTVVMFWANIYYRRYRLSDGSRSKNVQGSVMLDWGYFTKYHWTWHLSFIILKSIQIKQMEWTIVISYFLWVDHFSIELFRFTLNAKLVIS